MPLRCIRKEHLPDILICLDCRIHECACRRIAFPDLKFQKVFLVGIQGKVILEIGRRIFTDNPFQINIHPGCSCPVITGFRAGLCSGFCRGCFAAAGTGA